MTLVELEASLREKIGSPDVNTVSPAKLDRYLNDALAWMAVKLRWAIRTDEQSIALVADQLRYPLPQDLGWITYVTWNSTRLTPTSIWAMERDRIDWQTATSSTPSEYAVEGRFLVLHPPADSASVTTDSTLTYRGVFAAPVIATGGPSGISTMDAQLLAYVAAEEWLGNHPTPENQGRLQIVEKRLSELMPAAEERMRNPEENHRPRFQVRVGRTGGAR